MAAAAELDSGGESTGAGMKGDATPGTEAAAVLLGEAADQALMPVAEWPEQQPADPLPFRKAIGRMPVEVDVVVPVPDFKARHVLALAPGQVIESHWNHGEDVPLRAGEVRLAWTEFEVIENQLAVRVTRLP